MGMETAKYLAAQGAKVSIADVQEEPLKAVATEIESNGGKVKSTVVDVRDRAKVESWIKDTVELFGKIDGSANLAGIIGKQNNMAKIEDINDDDWDFVQAVNVKGLLNCMRAQIPQV
jgi:NADP-dependent 3-hydroxy acid dehydrogenase YdfG